MSSSDSKRPKGRRKTNAVTQVKCVDDLQAAIGELLRAGSTDAVHELEGILGAIKREFDPTTVTMTSTNIPDAITKLSSVIAETQRATRRVFELVERQKALLAEDDSYASALEALFAEEPVDSRTGRALISKRRATHMALREVCHEIVMAQGFQDLCAQKVEKVLGLLGDLNVNLRALLSYFKRAPAVPVRSDEVGDNGDIGQSDADEILKGFGI